MAVEILIVKGVANRRILRQTRVTPARLTIKATSKATGHHHLMMNQGILAMNTLNIIRHASRAIVEETKSTDLKVPVIKEKIFL